MPRLGRCQGAKVHQAHQVHQVHQAGVGAAIPWFQEISSVRVAFCPLESAPCAPLKKDTSQPMLGSDLEKHLESAR